ncbi:CAP domain-containing protein [Paenibacillus sediminis]|uniref:YkwD family protein n=1 Tax=Paenibacillus sediminis TaxID=664909 RepID=A0ABS4H0G7_9BACL|nr:CAP domain-containing protein [Paenibacillus sediminis]MBP1935847.1 putative YkwD family protein [Paenibacillus sediminis]
MNKNMTKRIAKTAVTATLAMGLLVPNAAFAAPSQTQNQNQYQDIDSIVAKIVENIKSQYPGANVTTEKMVITIPGKMTTMPSAPEKTTTSVPKKTTASAPKKPAATTTSTSKSQFAAQVVTLVNKERSKQGLKPLTVDTKLAGMAYDKAVDMYKNNYFDHNSPTYGSPFDMMKKYGIKFSYAGENIAKGQQSPQQVMDAWMNSAGHRANILNSNFTKIGVAYYNGIWVQEFIAN